LRRQRNGGRSNKQIYDTKKTINITEILDNIKETYQSWACCQGEVQRECEKQLFVDLPAR
jgi:hypothetical protein